ncbi:NAP-domain-containing protein [Dothidotthia symphoricarpi CBS 119687]|uniref:NAP-domain-containing protein n=1 Tax=Dothidotthia symphoricarpi CBS 119687 TaxID=1392245 RepID=A0A6A6AAD8_9PLEO|nr:NAP-domain-containing protein [Dothidotthia symphoricarpi CBS 119687]KAF2128526.1 NAP-domain-containing protein [Dothidotthia symphoricarpi CBS 119687]
MSEPIRNKKMDSISAPTPQNTPANAAPISSRAQQPGVGTIKEEELERAAAGLFAANPALVSMMQAKLSGLVGKSSGYVESLPVSVRRRVAGLKGVQKEHSKLEAQFQEEVLQLEKKYFAKFTPLYQARAKIVNGETEPTEEQVTVGEQKDKDDEDEDDDEETPELNKEEGKDVKGIPEFWLTALKTQPELAEMITDRDEAALKHLVDVRMEYLDRPGFRLIFEFEQNEFFSNKSISKTYFYQEENGYGGDYIYDHAEGEKVDWKSGKDLTVRIESKKQRNKNTKQTRVVKKTVPTDSFFNFFDPPKPPQDEDDATSDIEERLELDYQLGEIIKEKFIPHAIDWFTGEALQYENFDEFDEGDFEDEDDEDEDELSDRDEDEESDDEDDDTKPKQETTECKQS